MNKIRTTNQLQDFLDHEFSWRLREIQDIRSAARTAAGAPSQKTFIRAGVTLLYAHWEGFVKASADAYVNYLSCKGLRNSELRSCFMALGLKSRIHVLLTSSSRSTASISALDVILAELEKPANLPVGNAIDTQSNLSSAVFMDIVGWIGLDAERYSTKFKLLDESLLKRRNRIAHGKYLELDQSAFDDLVNQVLELLRWFKTDLENALATEAFVKPATPPAASSRPGSAPVLPPGPA